MAQVVVMPIMSIMNSGSYGAGFFSGSVMLAGASLMGHLLYGVVLGLVYKPGVAAALTPQTNL